MARLEVGIHFSGTIDNIVLLMGNDLSGHQRPVFRKSVLESREYVTTWQYAGNLMLASKIASPIYRAFTGND